MEGSTFSLLLDGSTKVIAFASQPLGRKIMSFWEVELGGITVLKTGYV